MVRDQIRAVLSELAPAAIKTGMLHSVEIIEAVVDALKSTGAPLIVDPVMVSTSGAELLQPEAAAVLRENLFPRAELITPNLSELEFLLHAKIKTPEELRSAARAFYAQYRIPVLAKGGHLRGREAIDFFFDGQNELMLSALRISGVSTHGTGCTYSAAITAFRARGFALVKSVIAAKNFISQAIKRGYRCGRHFVLGIH
jgi:hydroxymethylpyrimidine/phosphomethylpyrimidine kinase